MAFTPTVEKFKTLYPEFDSVDDVVVQLNLDMAYEIHKCSEFAVYALTAHFLYLQEKEGTGSSGSSATGTLKEITKSTVGRVKTEFASMSESSEDSYYETSPYGRKYLALRDASLKRFSTRVR